LAQWVLLVLEQRSFNRSVLNALVNAISGTGTEAHVERLIDLIAGMAHHDRITVTRYSVNQRPEFVSHRNFSHEMVRKYLEVYYPHDPFYRYWRTYQRPGVVPLNRLAGPDVKRGRYIAEFLNQSVISDEIGVLLQDEPGWCLGIFLDRSSHRFRSAEIERLELRFPVFAALHALHLRTRRPEPRPTPQASGDLKAATRGVPKKLWPELSARERQLVELILAGYPTALISKRLGITVGTVKNHRRRIYEKLDITTERELFLQYFEHLAEPAYPASSPGSTR
jgi:DNA-binding CsgD family transcriptional regulator